jgi:hypothetical protein
VLADLLAGTASRTVLFTTHRRLDGTAVDRVLALT